MRTTLGAVIALALAVLVAGAHDHSRARAQKQEATIQALLKNVRLGFSGCSPAVFFPLQSEMTAKILDITYEHGMLESFREEISYAKRNPILLTVTVNLTKWTGLCSSLEYSVEVAGTKLTSPHFDGFDESKLPRTVAFSPEENAGIILGGGPLQGELVTDLDYDEGRRYIRRQVFTTDGVKYEVSYSEYGYKSTGRIASFAARLSPLPR